MNNKWCVRCGRKTPTPYLRDNYKLLFNMNNQDSDGRASVMDIGCGNGRNSEFMKKNGHYVYPFDMANDYGEKIALGKDKIPMIGKHIDIILCNYVMMFLSRTERKQVIKEIKRVAGGKCTIMVELYPAKDSNAKTKEEMIKLQKEIFDDLKWDKLRYSQGKFIAQKA